MSDSASIHSYSAERLCSLCEEQSRHFREATSAVDSYCMEAFRRAVVENDEFCWQRLQEVYRNQIVAWCRAAAAGIQVPSDDLAAFVWEKFWQNYKPAKFAQARSLSQVLSYLKLCAMSAVFDARRESATLTSLDAPVGSSEGDAVALGELIPDQTPGPEEIAERKSSRERLLALVNAELRDDKERLIITDKFELGLTSRAIYALHSDVFDDVADVYRVTRNVLERLSRRLKDWEAGLAE
jgi:hypothetical protein